MTTQERPIGEHTQFQDDLSATTMLVAEQEPSLEHSQTADTQPTPAEQAEDAPAVVAEQAAPAAVAQTEPHADAPGVAEPLATPELSTAGAPVTVERQESVAAPDGTASLPAETENTSVSVASQDETVTPAAETTSEVADITPSISAVPAPSEAVSAETTPPISAVPAPAETVPTEIPAEAEAAPAEGASYTPPAEDTSRPRRVKDLQAGMELEGRVTSIALYGIFVDLGVGRDGLVHISEMSDTRIDSPSDIVQIGSTVKVRVKSVEPDGRRISLTMRSPERPERRERGGGGRNRKPELNRERLSQLRVGETVDGTVTGIAPFGVFVDIGVGKDGLVHISELAEGRIDKAEDAVQVGQTYPFKVLEVDADGTRISLSLRRAQRTQRMQQLENGQILEGTVSGIAPFGAFIDIGVGRDGLVHISELAENRVNKVEDVLTVGDKVKVRVLEADSGSKRISLSLLLEDRSQDEDAPRRELSGAREESAPREDRPARPPSARRDFSSPPRDDRARRDNRSARPARESEPIQYSTPDVPEFEGDNATLEDLLSKYGNGARRDNKRRVREEEPQEVDDGTTRRQRDAIRRTIEHMDEE